MADAATLRGRLTEPGGSIAQRLAFFAAVARDAERLARRWGAARAEPVGHRPVVRRGVRRRPGAAARRLGRGLRVLTAHLKWTPEGDRQASEVANALAALGRDGPSVLCGDLDDAVAHHATTPGLVAAGWRLAHPDGRAPTWAADGRRELLDALLIGPGLVVAHAHAIPGLPADGLPSGREPSDHVPLAADVAFADVAS